ncbi:hypothetical protein [Planosporangium mesophilum]|uniref:hypothetical protein n=1 Tax=Planosporangium mesophilum TaxID=689768 RepID=UPI00143BEBCA|nr:hypothetical protein [Planosporangium mesophilum]
MKLMTINRRPSTLPAACAQVLGVPVSPVASTLAHASVGHTGVVGGLVVGTSQIQAQRARIEGRNASTYGLKAKGSVEVDMTFGDVRGVPPRGRPV